MERIAKFYKVSKNSEIESFYDNIILPKRQTQGSAGYDFYIPYDLTIKPNETVKILTGIRCKIENGYVLMVFPRSGLGTKYRLMLDNTVGVIDPDYYNATNEGHIMIMMTNHSDKTLELKAKDRFAQGVFLKFGITEDDDTETTRTGGYGSTGLK